MYEWIIVGGGIQGCTLATFLIKSKKVDSKKIAIVDPHEKPLAQWKRNTNRIQMSYLRSPSVHHLDVNPLGLQQYAKEENLRNVFFGYYKKPSLFFFNEHSEKIFEDIHLANCWQTGRVVKVRRQDKGWAVETDNGKELFGKNLALAAGFTEQLCYPSWALPLREKHSHIVKHIFEEDMLEIEANDHHIAVVGSGITAAHTTIMLCKQNLQVTMFIKHPFRIYEFDSDPGWMGPKNMRSFTSEKDLKERRSMITEARHKGSVPRTIYIQLLNLVKQGKLNLIQSLIEDVKFVDDSLMISSGSEQVQVSKLILATGFTSNIGEIDWLQQLIQEEKLSCSECGFPKVKENLEWTDGLFVMGALAELEVGPTSRNIVGARRAADRIIGSF